MYGMGPPKVPIKKSTGPAVTQADIDREYLEKHGPVATEVPKGESRADDIPPQELFFDSCKKGAGYVVSGLVDDPKAKVDVNGRDPSGNTGLHYAALGGYATICQILVDHRADVNAANKQGADTPLHNACWKLRPSVIIVLTAAGADASLTNKSGRRPADVIHAPKDGDDAKYAKCLYDYAAAESDQLNFYAGDYVEVLNVKDPEWPLCRLDNQDGYVPSTYIQMLERRIDEECKAVLLQATQVNPDDLKGSGDGSGYSDD